MEVGCSFLKYLGPSNMYYMYKQGASCSGINATPLPPQVCITCINKGGFLFWNNWAPLVCITCTVAFCSGSPGIHYMYMY